MKRIMAGLAVLTTILGLISFFVFDVPSWISDWYYAVYLTPKAISVIPSEWSTTLNAQIVNNNPYPIYSVQLEIMESDSGTNIDGVVIKPDAYIIPTTFSTSTDMNGFVISGISKVTGRKWKTSIIYQMEAHSTIKISITIPPSKISENFNLKIKDFQKNSNPILEQQKATFVMFDIK